MRIRLVPATPSAVTNEKIANNAVTGPKLADGSVDTLDISEDVVLRNAKHLR
jgi:hypothetical protein